MRQDDMQSATEGAHLPKEAHMDKSLLKSYQVSRQFGYAYGVHEVLLRPFVFVQKACSHVKHVLEELGRIYYQIA